MPTVTVYASTDGSAPVLTGAVGSLNSLLDACLVNGYGAKSAAGWTKPFTGTNKAVFRMDTGGTGFYLNVDDAAAGAGGAREAMMTGFETMSAAGTGTNQFPTSVQLNLGSAPAGAVVCRKSTTADSTARAWTLIASNTFFYLFTETADSGFTSPIAASVFCFGDIISYKASDAYRAIIIGRNQVNIATSVQDSFGGILDGGAGLSATIAGHYIARGVSGIAGSVAVGKHFDYYPLGLNNTANSRGNATTSSSGTTALSTSNHFGFGQGVPGSSLNYPNAPDGGLHLGPVFIHHNGSRRGYLPGCWLALHDRPMSHNDTYSGTGNMAGKTLFCQWIQAAGGLVFPANIGQVQIETSSTWG